MLTLVSALQDHQYNVFVFDFTAHGANAGVTTFGYRESDEVRAAIDTMARRNDVDPTRFGLWGYNLGAYAALREAEKDPRVRAVALDSVYDYPKQMVKIGVEKTGVAGFPLMVKSAQTGFEWLNYGYKGDPPLSSRLKALNGVPVLFIQAADDPELASIIARDVHEGAGAARAANHRAREFRKFAGRRKKNLRKPHRDVFPDALTGFGGPRDRCSLEDH